MNQPTVAFINNGDLRTALLRGLATFHLWGHGGATTWVGDYVPKNLVKPTSPLLAFVSCPASKSMFHWVQLMARLSHCVVVVDVPFPLTRPDTIVAVHPEQSPDAMRFWTDPANLYWAKLAVRVADAVSTSRQQWDGNLDWWAELTALNPRAALIEDTQTPADVRRFGLQLTSLWHHCFTEKWRAP